MRHLSRLCHPCHPFRPLIPTWVSKGSEIIEKLETRGATRAGVTP